MSNYTNAIYPSDDISLRNTKSPANNELRASPDESTSFCGRCGRCLCAIRHFRITSEHKTELRTLVLIAVPMILTNLMQFLIQSESIIMCGHMGKNDLAAATLANSLINVVAISSVNGLLTACDTYFSQAFGMGRRNQLGVHFQRGLMMVFLLYTIVASIILNSERLLVVLGQDTEIARNAADYLLIVLPGIFCDFNFMLLARFMQNQNIINPPLVIAFNANIFNVVSQNLAIYVYGYGFRASAVCQASSLFLMLLQTLIYVYWKQIFKDCWDGWTKDAFYDWGPFIKLGIPGICMLAMEEWVYEAGTFLAGFMGTDELGAQSVLFQTVSVAYMIPIGLQISVAIRIGQQIGNMNPGGARLTYRVGVVIITTTSTIMAIGMVVFRRELSTIFSNEPNIIEIAATTMPVMAIYSYTDGLASVGYGVVRGCGRQAVGGFFILTGYYIVGVPVGVPLMLLTSLGVLGFWVGLLAGYTYVVVGVHIFVHRLDWSKECDKARVRLHATETGIEKNAEQSDDNEEDTPLLPNKSLTIRRKYGSRTVSFNRSVVALKSRYDHTIFMKILTQKLAIVAIFVSIVGASLFLRLYFPSTYMAPSTIEGNFTTLATTLTIH